MLVVKLDGAISLRRHFSMQKIYRPGVAAAFSACRTAYLPDFHLIIEELYLIFLKFSA